MAGTSIGIRIADGSFFPVLGEGTTGRKRVILTTVKDNQTGAQIDLYRGNGTGISGATYIGSLVIEEIEPAPKGAPEIELIMKVDEQGNLDAQASEEVTGEHQSLSVALDTLSGDRGDDLQEFELDERYQPELGVSPAEESRLTSEPIPAGFPQGEGDIGRSGRRRTLQFVGIAVLAVAILLIAVLLIYWLGRRPAAPSGPGVAAAPPTTSSKGAPAETGPGTGSPAQASQTPRSTGAAATGQAPAATPPTSPSTTRPQAPAAQPQYREGGVVYQLRWGDTLWDLSISFYRTPWLYGKIAKANNITNPDLIFAHTQIYIPER